MSGGDHIFVDTRAKAAVYTSNLMQTLATAAVEEAVLKPDAADASPIVAVPSLAHPAAATRLAVTQESWPARARGGFNSASLLWALTAPLLHRIRRGEGGLLVVNVLLAFKLNPAAVALGLSVVSVLCLLTLYLFNDLIDAHDDRKNPKKDHALAAVYAHYQKPLLFVWLTLTGVAVATSLAIDANAGAAVVVVSLVNVAYSLLGKKIPYGDLATVCLWGGSFTAIVTSNPAWFALTGIMTAVCHIYQASEDREADRANQVRTSAALASTRLWALQTALALALASACWALQPGLLPLSFAAFVYYWWRWHEQPRVGWFWSKVHFAFVVMWLIAST